MSRLIKIYIPNLSIAFTFIMLFLAVCNSIQHNSVNISSSLILQLAGLIIILILIDVMTWNIHFRKNITGYLLSGIIQCFVFLIYGIVCYWFRFLPLVLLDKVVVFIIIYTGICIYYHKVRKKEADEINELLKQKQ